MTTLPDIQLPTNTASRGRIPRSRAVAEKDVRQEGHRAEKTRQRCKQAREQANTDLLGSRLCWAVNGRVPVMATAGQREET